MIFSKRKGRYGLQLVLLVVIQSVLITRTNAQDSLAFGDKNWVSEALMGKIYLLPDTTRKIPKFDAMTPQGTIYSKKIDVSARQWLTGLPGVKGRSEKFGIVYTGSFKVKKSGSYIFRLLSDDGSKLFIDKKLIVDNDGMHVPNSRLGAVNLDDSKHSIRLEYFQGVAPQVALQLFATFEQENEMIFSSDSFTFITPPKKKPWMKYLIYVGIGLILLFILFVWLRRKKRMPTA